MQKMKRLAFPILAAAILASSAILGGCTRHPSDEEMKQLNDLKAEVAALEKQVSEREGTKANLEKQVAAKNDKLKWCADEKEIVKQRVADWK
jgi:outer membrane murein-binding lipoprotein Lpp